MSEFCIFCDIIGNRHKNDTDVRSEGGNVFSFVPLGPIVEGHRLFVSNAHTKDAAELPDVTGRVMKHASLHARNMGQPFNLITSAGKAATQSIFHLHVHYVPRRFGDGLTLPWTGQYD